MAEESTGLSVSGAGFTGSIIGLTLPTVTCEDLDTSHMLTTGNRTYIASKLNEGGALEAEILYDPAANNFVGVAATTVTVTFAGGGTFSFEGYINSRGASAPLGELMKGTVSIKVADDIT